MVYANVTLRRRWIGPMLVLLLLLDSISAALAAPGALPGPDRSVQQAAYPGLDSADPAERADAVQAIRRAKDAAAVPALMARIEDLDQRVGLYIAQALVELTPARLLPSLHARLWEVNADGRWRIAYVLGERRDTGAALALGNLLRDDEVLVVRTAAEALAKIGSQLSANILVLHLDSTRPAEAMAAMNALLLLSELAVQPLARAMTSDNFQSSMNAVLVLEAIGTPAAVEALHTVGL